MSFVDNDTIVSVEKAVALNLREQHTVRHQFNQRLRFGLIIETDLETDCITDTAIEFFRDSSRNASSCNPSRLRMPDPASLS